MNTNQTPRYDDSVNSTGCCPRFNPDGWDHRRLHFMDKRFLQAETRSLFHIPLNMGKVFGKAQAAIDKAKAMKMEHFFVLSEEVSPWKARHFFAVDKDVPGQPMTALSGDYLTQVFEGPFAKAQEWCGTLKSEVEKSGKKLGRSFLFYTTCPKCAKAYGKNYVVGVAELK